MGIFNLLHPTKKIYFSSKYNPRIELIETPHKKKIIVGGAEQTGGTITGMWETAVAQLTTYNLLPTTCLVFGLGGGDVIRSILKRYPETEVTCIEIDPVMIEVAKKYFDIYSSSDPPASGESRSSRPALPAGRQARTIKIINVDAFEWIKNKQNKKYDLVVVDLYIGKLNPKKAEEVSFLRQLKKLLAKGGFVTYNRHFFQSRNSDYENFLKRGREVFAEISELVKYKYCRVLKLDARR